MTDRSYVVSPIPPNDAAALRRRGGEVHVADAVPGYPCRQCLRDAEIGDELLLVSYDPFRSESPYRAASPVFLHRSDCGPADGDGAIPLQLRRRQLSVRSFDGNEMMIRAAVVLGEDLSRTIADFFTAEEAERLHVHNADRGCWAASITRAADLRPVAS